MQALLAEEEILESGDAENNSSFNESSDSFRWSCRSKMSFILIRTTFSVALSGMKLSDM